MPVKSAASVGAEVVGAGKGTTRQVLIGPEEGPNFALRRFIMEPGGACPGTPTPSSTSSTSYEVEPGSASAIRWWRFLRMTWSSFLQVLRIGTKRSGTKGLNSSASCRTGPTSSKCSRAPAPTLAAEFLRSRRYPLAS